MSTHSYSRSASVVVWSLAIVFLVFLVESPRLVATASERPVANEPAIAGAAYAPRVEAADRDPSVPAASGVTFPAGDDGESAIATF
jgi:hypothetical protein